MYIIPPIEPRIDANANIPPVARAQRSPKGQRAKFCQEQDVARNAYKANVVVLARAESMSSDRAHNYSVTFRIRKTYKGKLLGVDEKLRLTFLNKSKRMHCETEPPGKARGLVKAQIQQSKEYYLFLKSDGMHRYSVQGKPVLKKDRQRGRKDPEKEILKVTAANFGK